jgi:RNA polymerase sigma-70 factor, ECF subfamily
METDADYAALAVTIRRGGVDREAAERALCLLFSRRIRLYGIRHLGDEERAAELVQIVLVALIEALRAGRVEEPNHLDRFTLGICRNSVLRMRELDARLEPRAPEDLDVIAVDPPEAPIELEPLFRCIAALDERSRAVVFLSFQEERSSDEIGTALGTTGANVRVLRHRALGQLRRCLDRGAGKAELERGTTP